MWLPAPVSDEIDIPILSENINRTLGPRPDVLNKRERSGPEDDATWDHFDNARTHVATREDIPKLGKDPDHVAPRCEDSYWGLGDDAYMFQLDIMHVSQLPQSRDRSKDSNTSSKSTA